MQWTGANPIHPPRVMGTNHRPRGFSQRGVFGRGPSTGREPVGLGFFFCFCRVFLVFLGFWFSFDFIFYVLTNFEVDLISK
jgi:hypothetical protein